MRWLDTAPLESFVTEPIQRAIIAGLKSGKTLEAHDKEGSTRVFYDDSGFQYRYEGQMGESDAKTFDSESEILAFIRSAFSFSAPNPREDASVWPDILRRLG